MKSKARNLQASDILPLTTLRSRAVTLTALLTTTAFGFGHSAHAYESSPRSAEHGTDPAPETALAEVVVTAQRRSENLQRVPISVVALSNDQLKASGISTTADLPTLTPGLNNIQAAGYFMPHLRGVGTSADAASVENPVATYVDGVYWGHQAGSILSLSNIRQIEIDKGPQGTLFGRNATGGLIQITTRDPTQEAGGQLDFGYGNYDTTTTNAYVTGGLTDHVAGDLAVYFQSQGDGYGTNLFNGEPANKFQNLAMRSKWLIAASDDTRLTFIFDFEKEQGYPTLAPVPGTLSVGGNVPTKGQDVFVASSFYDRSKQGGASFKLEHNFGIGEFSSITAYRRGDYVVAFPNTSPDPASITIPLLNDKFWQASQEFQFASPDTSHIKWVSGAFFYTANAGWKPLQIYGPALGPLAISINDEQKTYSGAIYGQATIPILTATNLTLGARYTVDRRNWQATESFTGIPIPSISDSAHGIYKKATWRVGLDHSFNDTVMIYASANRGFKSGGFNDSVLSAAAYQPEVLDAFETGAKTAFLDRRLTFNTSAFYYRYTNMQVTRFFGGNENVYNGGAAHIYGLDVDLNARVSERLQVRSGLEWLHGEFTSFPQADYTVPAPGGGSIFSTRDARGNQLPYAPNWTGHVAGDYTIASQAIGELRLNLTYYYNSGWYPNPDNRLHQAAYDLLNASLTWLSRDDKYHVSLWGKNLGNTRYAVLESEQGNGDFLAYAPPLTFGITVGMNFGGHP